MFTQFFGNYLVNENIITSKQLVEALKLKSSTKVKLGVLAINAGYMNAEQVNKVHNMQSKVDKRIGDIAVDMGYLMEAQVEELLSSQKPDYLLLGQTLIDNDFLTNEEFSNALNTYKEKYALEDADLTGSSEKARKILSDFFDFSNAKNPDILVNFVELLINNLIRFVGDDFTPMDSKEAITISSSPDLISVNQGIIGTYSSDVSIVSDEKSFISFASRFALEEFQENNEYVKASVEDFLNLNNGLFIVNESQMHNIELTLNAPETIKNGARTEQPHYVLAVCYPFGIVNFIFNEK